MNHKVSIVIIGRNEERGISECIGAALSAAEQIGGAEIIFVDSASTDKTVSIVQLFDVRVISLKPSSKLSPSAGRFIGSQYANGDFILFIDADTLVYKDFLPIALQHFEEHSDVAGINGYLDDLNEKGELLTDVEERFEDVANVKWLRGPCCFYRREALLKIGSFNPHLAVEEEAELGLRFVKNGWKLKILPVRMACHTRCYHTQTINSIFKTFKRDIVSKRLGEMTKTIGYAFQEGNGLVFCWLRLKTTIIFTTWLLILAVCYFLPEFLHPDAVIFSIVIFVGFVVLYKKHSIKQTLLFFIAKFFCLIDILAGLHKFKFNNAKFDAIDIEHSPLLQKLDN